MPFAILERSQNNIKADESLPLMPCLVVEGKQRLCCNLRKAISRCANKRCKSKGHLLNFHDVLCKYTARHIDISCVSFRIFQTHQTQKPNYKSRSMSQHANRSPYRKHEDNVQITARNSTLHQPGSTPDTPISKVQFAVLCLQCCRRKTYSLPIQNYLFIHLAASVA